MKSDNMKRIAKLLFAMSLAFAAVSCDPDNQEPLPPPDPGTDDKDPVVNCVLPESVKAGGEVQVQWDGFKENAEILLVAEDSKEYPMQVKVVTSYGLTFKVPAKTPAGMPCGSMGPTTAGRMDPYVDEFQDHGGSMIMLAKGNRSIDVTNACQKHGGFYLGSIGGPAAILAQENIKSIECVEYPELGMEAIWKIEVENFPAFILVDDKGNDFFKQLKPCEGCTILK